MADPNDGKIVVAGDNDLPPPAAKVTVASDNELPPPATDVKKNPIPATTSGSQPSATDATGAQGQGGQQQGQNTTNNTDTPPADYKVISDAMESKPLPANYDLLKPESYKNLQDGQSYIMPKTADGEPHVRTWDAASQQFKSAPALTPLNVTKQDAIATAYVDNKKAQDVAVTKLLPETHLLTSFAPVLELHSLQQLLTAAPVDEKPKIQANIDALMQKPLNSDEFSGTRIQPNTETHVFQGTAPTLLGGQVAAPFTGVLPDVPLPDDIKTVGDAYRRVIANNMQLQDIKNQTTELTAAKIEEQVKALPAAAQAVVAATPDDQKESVVQQLYNNANTPQTGSDKGMWYSFAKGLSSGLDALVNNDKYEAMSPQELKLEMGKDYFKDKYFGTPEGDLGNTVANMAGEMAPALAGTAVTGGEMAPVLFGVDAANKTKAQALKQYYYNSFDTNTEPNYNDAFRYSNQQAMIQGGTQALVGALGGEGTPIKFQSWTDAATQVLKNTITAAGRDAIILGGASKVMSDIVNDKFNVASGEGYTQSMLNVAVPSALLHLLTHGPKTIRSGIKGIDSAMPSLATLPDGQVSDAVNDGVKNGWITQQEGNDITTRTETLKQIISELPNPVSVGILLEIEPLYNEKQALIAKMGDNVLTPEMKTTNAERLKELDRQILLIAEVPLTETEAGRLKDLKEQAKENDGTLSKLDRAEFNRLSKRNDAAADKKKVDNLPRINVGQEQLPLIETEDDRLRLPDGTKYVTKEGDNYIPHIKGEKTEKPIVATDAGKAPPTKVGNVTIGEHGEDKYTAQGKENGTEKKDPLTADGVKEAENQAKDVVANNPDVKTIFHGTVERTKQTADIIAKKATELSGHPVTTQEIPELDTWNVGDAEGEKDGTFDEKKWAYEKPEDIPPQTGPQDNGEEAPQGLSKNEIGDAVPPGGESWNSFAERAKKAWDILKAHPDNDHAVASSKMERMLSSLNETNGDVDKAKEVYFKKLDAENAAKPAPEPNLGTKKAINDQLRETMGLKPLDLPKLASRNDRLDAAKKLVDSGEVNPLDVVQELLNHKSDPENADISIRDESVLQYHDMQLRAQQRELNKSKLDLQEELQKDPTNENLKEQIASINLDLQNSYDLRAKRIDASQIGGKIWSGIGNTRQTEIDALDRITNSINIINTAYDGDTPEAVKAELNDLKAKHDLLTAKTDKLEADLKKEQAKREVDNAIKTQAKRKVSREALTTQKEQALNNIKDKVGKLTAKLAEKSGGKLNFADDNEDTRELLSSISSDVGTLLSVYAKQGVITLDEMLEKIHADIKGLANISKEQLRDVIAGKYSENKPLSDVRKQVNDIRAEARQKAKIESLENGIALETKSNPQSEKSKALQKELADAKKQALNEYPNLSADELNKRAATLQKQIDKGEFAKTPIEKRIWEKDPKWVAANKAKNDVKQRLRILEQQALDAKKTRTMRAMDIAQQWSRRGLFLMSQAYQLKMASTTLSSLVTKPIHEVLGAGFTKAFPAIGTNAPIEGGSVNLNSLAAFYLEYFNPVKLYKGTRDIIDLQGKTGGETELEKAQETAPKENHIRGVDLLTTDPHRIIKDPLKRAAYESAMVKHLDWYQTNGLNPNDHVLQETAKAAAYLKGKSEIFTSSGEDDATKAKQNGPISAIKKDFADIESKAIEQGDNASYGAAQIWKFLNPIVGVPTNILGVVSRGNPISFAKNLGGAFLANKDVANGIKSLSQNESDLIIRNLKQGAVGTAFYMMGAFAVGAKAGGLYTRFNKEKDNKNADLLKVDGFDVPKNAQHSPQIQAYQVGATWAIVYNQYLKKGNSNAMAAAMATAANIGNYADMEPIISETGKLYDAIKTPGGLKKFGDDFKSRVGVDKAEKIMVKLGLMDEVQTLSYHQYIKKRIELKAAHKTDEAAELYTKYHKYNDKPKVHKPKP